MVSGGQLWDVELSRRKNCTVVFGALMFGCSSFPSRTVALIQREIACVCVCGVCVGVSELCVGQWPSRVELQGVSVPIHCSHHVFRTVHPYATVRAGTWKLFAAQIPYVLLGGKLGVVPGTLKFCLPHGLQTAYHFYDGFAKLICGTKKATPGQQLSSASWPRQKPAPAKLSKHPSSHAGQPSSHMRPSMHSRPVSWR